MHHSYKIGILFISHLYCRPHLIAGFMSAKDAQRALKAKRRGTFILRFSEELAKEKAFLKCSFVVDVGKKSTKQCSYIN